MGVNSAFGHHLYELFVPCVGASTPRTSARPAAVLQRRLLAPLHGGRELGTAARTPLLPGLTTGPRGCRGSERPSRRLRDRSLAGAARADPPSFLRRGSPGPLPTQTHTHPTHTPPPRPAALRGAGGGDPQGPSLTGCPEAAKRLPGPAEPARAALSCGRPLAGSEACDRAGGAAEERGHG